MKEWVEFKWKGWMVFIEIFLRFSFSLKCWTCRVRGTSFFLCVWCYMDMGVAYFKYYYHHTSSSSSSSSYFYVCTSTLQSHNITQARGMNKRVFFPWWKDGKSDFFYEHIHWTQWTPISFLFFILLKGLVLMGFVWCVIKNGFLDHWIMRVKINSTMWGWMWE